MKPRLTKTKRPSASHQRRQYLIADLARPLLAPRKISLSWRKTHRPRRRRNSMRRASRRCGRATGSALTAASRCAIRSRASSRALHLPGAETEADQDNRDREESAPDARNALTRPPLYSAPGAEGLVVGIQTLVDAHLTSHQLAMGPSPLLKGGGHFWGDEVSPRETLTRPSPVGDDGTAMRSNQPSLAATARSHQPISTASTAACAAKSAARSGSRRSRQARPR